MSNDWSNDADDSIARIAQARKQQQRLAQIGGALLLAAIAVVPMLFGNGLFGLSACGRDDVNLWIYNTTDAPVEVTLRRDAIIASSEAHALDAYGTVTLFTSAGKRSVTIQNQGADETLTLDLQRPTLLSVGSTLCYAVLDITELYNKESAAQPAFRVVDRIPAGQSIYESSAQTFIPPRARMPRTAQSPVHWAEDFDCALLAPEMEETLMLRAQTKLIEREGPAE